MFLKAGRERSGWPSDPLSDELEQIWSGVGESPPPPTLPPVGTRAKDLSGIRDLDSVVW